ncbi:MAG: hypothetical protein KDH96_10960, partial [Candidatus Riesia sp.]|nr:hypothetical protein [Candidatus Riesia sp.]
VKKFYDTEFEATIAAARASHDFSAELVPYKCGKHWHIANKDKRLRSKVRPYNRTYCDACETYLKPTRWDAHQRKRGHIGAVKRKGGE